jgi:hypothetical protein
LAGAAAGVAAAGAAAAALTTAPGRAQACQLNWTIDTRMLVCVCVCDPAQECTGTYMSSDVKMFEFSLRGKTGVGKT